MKPDIPLEQTPTSLWEFLQSRDAYLGVLVVMHRMLLSSATPNPKPQSPAVNPNPKLALNQNPCFAASFLRPLLRKRVRSHPGLRPGGPDLGSAYRGNLWTEFSSSYHSF